MLRAIASVIIGYVVIVVWVIVTMTVAWLVLGQSFAFTEGTTEITTAWSVVAIVLGFVGAIIGGVTAAAIARSPTNRPVKVLAGLVLVLGLVEGVLYLVGGDDADTVEGEVVVEDEATGEVGEIGVMEAASKGEPPTWYLFTMPVVGLVGVLVGGGLLGSRTGGAASVPRASVDDA